MLQYAGLMRWYVAVISVTVLAAAGCGNDDEGGKILVPTATLTRTPTVSGSPTLSPTPTPTRPPTPDPTQIQAFADEIFAPLVATNPTGTPTPRQAVGIVVAVTLGSPQQRYYYSFGQFPKYPANSPGENLLDLPPERIEFEIGSNTKVFNATVLAAAVLDDPQTQVRVSLDTRVEELVAPAGVHMQRPAGHRAITLRDLATQTGTFADHPCNDASPYLQADLWCFLNNWVPQYEPGKYWFYSDTGFITLAECTSYAFHKSYGQTDQLITDIILRPLNMTDTVILTGSTSDPDIRARLAQAFEQLESGRYVRSSLPNYPPENAGSGNLTSSPADMMTFLEAQMGPVSDPALQKAIQLTQMPATTSMGLAWQLASEGWLIKNGGLGGWETYMIVNPGLRIGVMVFSNTGGMSTPNEPDLPSLDNEVDGAGRRLAERIADATVAPFTWATPSVSPQCPQPFPTCDTPTPTVTPTPT